MQLLLQYSCYCSASVIAVHLLLQCICYCSAAVIAVPVNAVAAIAVAVTVMTIVANFSENIVNKTVLRTYYLYWIWCF